MKTTGHILFLAVLLFAAVFQAAAQTESPLNCRITLVYADGDSAVYSSNRYGGGGTVSPSIKRNIKIVFAAENQDGIIHGAEYSFRLKNAGGFSPWSTLREAFFCDLKDGEYTFLVRARQGENAVSDIKELTFRVKTPQTRNTAAVIATALIAALLIAAIVIEKKKFAETKAQLVRQKESLNNTLKDLSLLSSAGQCIIKSQKKKDISRIAAEELKKFFEVDDIGIGIYNAPKSSLDFSASVLKGVSLTFSRYNIEIVNNLVVWTYLHGKPVMVSDYKKQLGDYIDTDYYKIDTSLFGSGVYIPLFDNGMTIGVFTVHSLKKNYFTTYHLSILQNLATYIEYAIVNITYMRKNEVQKKQIEIRNVYLREKQKEMEKLNAELQKFSLSVRKAETSVIMVDDKKNISWVNDGFTKIYGYTFEEYTANGASYKTAVRNPVTIEYFDKVYASGKPETFSLLHYTKTGREIWIQSTVTPVVDEKNGSIQLIVTDTDITAVKRAETELKRQRNEIEQKNKEVTKSIEYASIIQTALMTGKTVLKQTFADSFLLTLPKAIVSGDFFWMGHKFSRKYLALCDCAGHGVPGAFVSLMGKMFLDEILQDTREEDTPGCLIRRLNDKLYEAVSSLSDKVGGIDGMDLSFCIINEGDTRLDYAGAYRPLYLVRNGTLQKLLPERCSLGNIAPGDGFQFETKSLDLLKGDFLLMSSDGYSDQFGCVNGKKMGRNSFEKLVIEASQLQTSEMSEFFLKKHLEWRGGLEQVDDISVLGIRL